MHKRLFGLIGGLCAMWIALFVYGLKTDVLFGAQDRKSSDVVQSQVTTISHVSTSTSSGATSSTHATNAFVARVVDGDTIDVLIDGQKDPMKVRLLGVNTPETVDPRKPAQCFGKEASAFSHQLMDGKRVQLDADPQADERDKYGRLLRNVVLDNGTDVNAMLVREGYAHAYLSFPLNPERKRELKSLENQAKEAQRGL